MLSAAASAPSAPPAYGEEALGMELQASEEGPVEVASAGQATDAPPVYEGYDASLWTQPQMYQSEATVIPSAPKVQGASQGDGCSAGFCRAAKQNPCTSIMSACCWPCVVLLLIGIVVNDFLLILIPAQIAGFVYFLYLFAACSSSDGKYLSNIMQNRETQAHIDEMKRSPPVFWYKIVCSHTSGSGKRRHRVVTHTAYAEFAYSIWTDLSPANPDFSAFEATKTKLPVQGLFGDEFTQRAYDHAKEAFYAANTRDRDQSKTSGVKINGQILKVLTVLDGAETPAWMTTAAQRWCACFGFGTIYNGMLEGRTGKLKYEYVKKIYCLPDANPTQPISELVPQAVTAPVPFIGEGETQREDSFGASPEGHLAHTQQMA